MKGVYRLVINICKLLPIKKKKIFLMSYYGSQYGCNPKYLSEYIVKNHPDWKVVWAFINPESHCIEGVLKVRYLSLSYFYELYTSRVFVTNYRMTSLYRKRKGQLYVQTWHSSLRLKMIEGDAEDTIPSHYVEMAKKDSMQTDILLSGCDFSTRIFKRAFWFDGEIAPTGTPREDLMFLNDDVLRQSIRDSLGVGTGVRIVLYAPTFRKDNTLKYYDLDFRQLIYALEDHYGGKWKVLLRLHPHLRDFSKELLGDNPDIIDATDYDDIQELLYVSDMVISDYSSLIFDYVLTQKPCLLYVPDLEEYTNTDRKLYFDINQLPFLVFKDQTGLFHGIQSFDSISYKDRIRSFLNGIGSYETGHECENVMKMILDKIQ